jgi:hypothetical protein
MKSILKKIIAITFLTVFALRVFAPVRSTLIIDNPPAVEPFRNLIYAVGMVETQLDTLAVNPLEEAVGFFQIRPIRLMDYNIRTGSSYKTNDLFNYKISEKIFLYYASEIGPYNLERISKAWNGSGESTKLYWARVQKYLE